MPTALDMPTFSRAGGTIFRKALGVVHRQLDAPDTAAPGRAGRKVDNTFRVRSVPFSLDAWPGTTLPFAKVVVGRGGNALEEGREGEGGGGQGPKGLCTQKWPKSIVPSVNSIASGNAPRILEDG